jgi:AmiR/NasT family two-component response regulator
MGELGANGVGSVSMETVGVALDTVTEALDQLRSATAAEETLGTVLGRLARTAVIALLDADAVSVTRIDAPDPVTIVATDDTVLDIDAQQYAADRGPCLAAARGRTPVRAVIGEHTREWPEFCTAAQQAGIRAYLSVPVIVDGDGPGELVGSFNVYSYRVEAFDPFDEMLMRLLTTAASASISNSRRWHSASGKVGQLKAALMFRAEIDQAKGMLMAMHHITADEAVLPAGGDLAADPDQTAPRRPDADRLPHRSRFVTIAQ